MGGPVVNPKKMAIVERLTNMCKCCHCKYNPVVFYVKYRAGFPALKVGERAMVVVYNHPKFEPNKLVQTSVVKEVFADGRFETANTLYHPE